MFTLVDYKYKDLFWKSHVDKQMKIEVCDYIGHGAPSGQIKKAEGKIYYDDIKKNFYKCKKNGAIYNWEEANNNYERLIFNNEDIHWEDFELTESLCSEPELRFGLCEASVVKFQIRNAFISLKNKWILISEILDGNADMPFEFGRYKVFSDVPTADREYRDVTAYDSMYDIINSSAIEWYNTILPNNDSEVTMKQFRSSFIENFGLEEFAPVTGFDTDGNFKYLVNDDMVIKKTIQVGEGTEVDNEQEQISIIKESSLSGLNVISAICEINGCFGHIGRDGKFHYIYLTQDMMGLYPSNTLFPDHAPDYLPQSETGHLYPQSPKSTRVGNGAYINADYEDFLCKKINKVQIRQEENDIGGMYPKEKLDNLNKYVIENNFLVYGKSDRELSAIAKNIFDKITNIIYRPFSCESIGNPCLEVGDAVRLSTKYMLIESYILNRTLKGIQSMKDSYSTEGVEEYSEKVNSVSQSIIQLKGKTNTLIRNVDETRSELTKFEKDANGNFLDVRSSIIQTAEDITATVSRNTQNYDVKDYDISLFGYFEPTDIKMPYKANEHNEKYYLNQSNGNLYQSNGLQWIYIEKLQTVKESAYSEIKQTADNITSTVEKTYETKDDAKSTKTELKSSIEQTASSITSTVASSSSKYDAENYHISLFGYKDNPDIPYDVEESNGDYYLNQSNGNLYWSIGTEWIFVKRLELITYNLSTRIEQTEKDIKLKVSADDVGTEIEQNAYSVRIAWNKNSKYIQFENGELAIYDGNATDSKKRAVFNQNGNHFYRDGYYVGKIGTNQFNFDNSKKGLVFDLEAEAAYMTWAAEESADATAYTVKLMYANKDFGDYKANTLYAGCDLDMRNHILKNVVFEGGGINGTLTFVQPLEVDSSGIISSWSQATLKFQNGILVSGSSWNS